MPQMCTADPNKRIPGQIARSAAENARASLLPEACPAPVQIDRPGPLTQSTVLALQRSHGNAYVQRRFAPSGTVEGRNGAVIELLPRLEPPSRAFQPASARRTDAPVVRRAPTKAPSGPRGGDDQEQSWANPMKNLATEPALVATIYFRTKEFAADDKDNEVLETIAKAYAPWTMRNRGLRGAIIGYADPRPSIEPNNADLSAKRAHTLEWQLLKFLFKETSLQGGAFDFEKKAGGVAPRNPNAELGAEEVSLGWQRRAELFLVGQAVEPEPQQRDEPPPPPVVPEPEKHADDLDRWLPQIKACKSEYAKGLAMRLLGYLSVSLIPKSFRYTGSIPILIPVPGVSTPPRARGIASSKGAPAGSITYGKHGGTLPFQAVKPPWWDNRSSGYVDPYMYRRRKPIETPCDKMVRTSMMLIRDMRDVNKHIDLTVKDSNSAYLKFMAELRKDEPDVSKLREYAVPIEYLLFMWDATADEARELSAIADTVEGD